MLVVLTPAERNVARRKLAEYEGRISRIYLDCGRHQLRNRWPNLNVAIAKRDWAVAAEESILASPIAPVRNAYTRQLFLRAAEKVGIE